jgi:hypothetical protein
MKIRIVGCILLLTSLSFISRNASSQILAEKKMIAVPAEVIVDKIRGGMLGQILGNLNGIPHEFKYYDKPGEVETYTPALPDGAKTDDDTDFEWVYIYHMQKNRTVLIPYDELKDFWISSINRSIWNSNRYARYLMDLGIRPPLTGNVVFNPWAEFNVSGQFLCETFGLLAPAMPQTAAKIGLHYTLVAINQEPAQTTQLFTSMISTAFMESDIQKIIDAGIASLDPNSIMIQIIADVRKWYTDNPQDYKETHRLIHSKYELDDARTRNQNGTELNTAAIIAALLYGNGDFAESLRYAFNFGYDADCNAATVGTIMGTVYGYRRMLSEGWKIVDRYENTTRDNMPMDETITSFADRLIELFEIVNQENGGSKYVLDKTLVYTIPVEEPASVIQLYSSADQKELLIKHYEKDILAGLLEGSRRERARSAYMAVCLDTNASLAKKYPKQWKQASFDLSGYWKVMSNVFHGANFKSMMILQDKFIAAGFSGLANPPKAQDLYDDPEPWKDPETLYGQKKK